METASAASGRQQETPPALQAFGRTVVLMAKKRTMSQEFTGPARLPPTDFHASRDRTPAGSLTLNPIPRKLASQFPKIRRDNYAVLNNEEVLLVDPQTRKVVAVIKGWSDAGLGG